MASTIDDEIRSSDTWPSLKRQLPYSHAPCYKSFDEVEMVAVCDLIEEKCKEFCRRWDVPRYYLDYREMIEKQRPDVVSIATAAGLHAEMAVFAMEHGARGVYCEKAMCCSLAEADAIVDCVRRHGVKFMLGAQRRHHPHFRQAREGRCAVGFLIKRHHDDAGFRRRVLRAGHMMAQPKEHVGGKPIQPVERRQPGQRPHEHRQHEQRRTGPHNCPADGHGLLDRKLPMPLVSTSGAQFTPARPQTDTK